MCYVCFQTNSGDRVPQTWLTKLVLTPDICSTENSQTIHVTNIRCVVSQLPMVITLLLLCTGSAISHVRKPPHVQNFQLYVLKLTIDCRCLTRFGPRQRDPLLSFLARQFLTSSCSNTNSAQSTERTSSQVHMDHPNVR